MKYSASPLAVHPLFHKKMQQKRCTVKKTRKTQMQQKLDVRCGALDLSRALGFGIFVANGIGAVTLPWRFLAGRFGTTSCGHAKGEP